MTDEADRIRAKVVVEWPSYAEAAVGGLNDSELEALQKRLQGDKQFYEELAKGGNEKVKEYGLGLTGEMITAWVDRELKAVAKEIANRKKKGGAKAKPAKTK